VARDNRGRMSVGRHLKIGPASETHPKRQDESRRLTGGLLWEDVTDTRRILLEEEHPHTLTSIANLSLI
jgi:hypothetical protein